MLSTHRQIRTIFGAYLGIPLIKSLDVEVHGLVVGALSDSVVLASSNQLHTVSQIPLPVPVTNAGNISLLLLDGKWVVVVELADFLRALQDLLREVVIDERCLKSEIAGRIQAVALILGRLSGSFAHGQQIWNTNENS